MEVSWWQLIILIIIGPIIGGLAGGVSLFLSRLGYRWWTKPILEIGRSFTQEALDVDGKWREIGFEIRNNGKSVAKNCRGVLTIEDLESEQDIVDTRIWGAPVSGGGVQTEFEQIESWLKQHDMETAKNRAIDLNKVHFILNRRVKGIDFKEKEVHWDYSGSPIDLDINKGDKNRLFIARVRHAPLPGYVGDKFDVMDIPSGYGWDKVIQVALRLDRKYKFTLKISSANAVGDVRTFRLYQDRIEPSD